MRSRTLLIESSLSRTTARVCAFPSGRCRPGGFFEDGLKPTECSLAVGGLGPRSILYNPNRWSEGGDQALTDLFVECTRVLDGESEDGAGVRPVGVLATGTA